MKKEPIERPVRRKRILRGAALLLFLSAAAWVLLATPVGREAMSPEGRARIVASIDRWVRDAGPAGPLLFILIYAAGALVLPATVLTIAGAFIFGPWLGFLYNTLGALIAASAAFLIARHLLREEAARFLKGRLRTLDEQSERHGFSAVFYMRILFFPFLPLNYAAGVTRIHFRDYFFATLLGLPLGSFILSYFFGSLKGIVAAYRTPADLLRLDVLLPVGLFAASLFIPKIVRKFIPAPPRD
ncbi:MAG TPA: TVP38/TMEM64 family protein [Candidatus Deferrimicrobiaceae bacterium]|jgi:uncharacterized membrane protein YdjX (TVP38/TMEM64 family)